MLLSWNCHTQRHQEGVKRLSETTPSWSKGGSEWHGAESSVQRGLRARVRNHRGLQQNKKHGRSPMSGESENREGEEGIEGTEVGEKLNCTRTACPATPSLT